MYRRENTMVSKLKNPRRLAALAVFAIIAMAAFGFAAANSVPASRAGTDTGGVSGYTITNISYTIDSSDVTKFSGVSFTLDAAAGSAYAYTATATTNACSNTANNDWECTFATSQDIGIAFGSLGVTAAD